MGSSIGTNCALLVVTTALILSIMLFQANLNDVRTELKNVKTELTAEKAKIEHIDHTMTTQIAPTIKELDTTVSNATVSMTSAVKKVNEDVSTAVSTQDSFLAYQFAGIFTLIGGLISIWHMTAHLSHFNEPIVQRKILAILWMGPLYSLTSFLSLVFVTAEAFLAVIKDCYEAYCIYTFLSFLIAVLGRGDRNAVIDLLASRADQLKMPVYPCDLLSSGHTYRYENDPKAKAEAVLHQCQLFAMQFVLLRPLTTIAMIISNLLYQGEWDFRSPQLYFVVITNISVCVAFSGLLKFYHAVHKDLEWCRPFPKFLCIKGVVFMTFWQYMALAIFAKIYVNNFESSDAAREWTTKAQNFLVCLEMLFFAVAHFFIFPTEEWEEGYRTKTRRSSQTKIGDHIAFRDFVQDVKLLLKARKEVKGNRKDYDATLADEASSDAESPVDDSQCSPGLRAKQPAAERTASKTSLIPCTDESLVLPHDASVDEGSRMDPAALERLKKFIEEADREQVPVEIV